MDTKPTDIRLLEAGKIVNTHGIRGEVRILPWADSPSFLTGLSRLYIDGVPVKVISARAHKSCVIATLEGICDIDAAIRLKNKTVYISRDDVKLEEGRFFIADLVGLRAINHNTNEELGTVAEVMSLPANNVYVIKGRQGAPDCRDIMVPAVPEFIVEVNISGGYIKFHLIEGM